METGRFKSQSEAPFDDLSLSVDGLPSELNRAESGTEVLRTRPSLTPNYMPVESDGFLLEFRPTPAFSLHLGRSGSRAIPLFAIPPGQFGAWLFRAFVEDARASHGPFGSCLHLYEAEEYARMRLFLDGNGLAGFALEGTEIVSVFNHRKSLNRHVSRSLLALAVQLGGNRLNAFETVLPTIYRRCGFVPISRLAWNDDEAPSDWDYAATSAFNQGRPNVVYMAFGCPQFPVVQVNSFAEGVESQLKALERRRRALVLGSTGSGKTVLLHAFFQGLLEEC